MLSTRNGFVPAVAGAGTVAVVVAVLGVHAAAINAAGNRVETANRSLRS